MSNADQLVRDYMRVQTVNGATVLKIAEVGWNGPHSASLTWWSFRTWEDMPSPAEIAKAQKAALANPAFFRPCTHCGDLCAVGRLGGDDVCHDCEERHFGICH